MPESTKDNNTCKKRTTTLVNIDKKSMHFGHTAISHLILNSAQARLRQRRRVFGQTMRCQLHTGHKGHSAEMFLREQGREQSEREKVYGVLNSISIVLNSFSNTH